MKNKHEKILKRYQDFLNQCRSLCLSTVDATGGALIGYAPYLEDEKRNFFVYLSELSDHTIALQESKQVSILFIEDEGNTKEIFARTRAIFECKVLTVERKSDQWDRLMDQMNITFGNLISTLRSLSDFHLFQFQPIRGTFIMGFGQAYSINGEKMDQLKQVKVKKTRKNCF